MSAVFWRVSPTRHVFLPAGVDFSLVCGNCMAFALDVWGAKCS